MSLVDKTGKIWMDGEYVPWGEAKVHVLSFSLHYGIGVFEGVRAYATDKGPAIFRLEEHTQRLLDSAHILQMPVTHTKEALMTVQKDIVGRNKLKSAYLRPLICYGAKGLGLHAVMDAPIQTIIAAWEWGAYLGADALEKGVRIKTSSFARNSITSTMCKAKAVGNYINSILALHEVTAAGYDEALLLDHNGFVAEGSGENIFIVRDGVISTPERANILEGITRGTIMQLAMEAGYKLEERNITRDEVYIADEAFFSGTAAEITPIVSLDDRKIGDGKRGPLTADIQKRYFDVVHGRDKNHEHWLTYLND